jgi:hypothetical protein
MRPVELGPLFDLVRRDRFLGPRPTRSSPERSEDTRNGAGGALFDAYERGFDNREPAELHLRGCSASDTGFQRLGPIG